MGYQNNLHCCLYLLFILLEILLCGVETSDVGLGLPGVSHLHHHDGPGKIERPYFDIVGPRNVTAVIGQTAQLRCRVRHLGDRTVSWIRKRDLHVLTSEIFTFTGDARFALVHPENSDDWTLEIRFAQKRDAGVYECQINTEPKMNLAMLLNVEDRELLMEPGSHSNRPTKEAQVKIWGPDDVYVKTGSTISLTCSVTIQSQPPGSIAWYHGSNIVDFDSPRGGISLETEKIDTATTSKLLVTKATPLDSGNYSCLSLHSNAQQASVWVHVLNGEHPAAMQHGEHSGCSSNFSTNQFYLFLILISYWLIWR